MMKEDVIIVHNKIQKIDKCMNNEIMIIKRSVQNVFVNISSASHPRSLNTFFMTSWGTMFQFYAHYSGG